MSIVNRPSLTLLLVEDFPVDRELYRRYLNADLNYSYRFLEADSAQAGLALCQTQAIDAIVLDYLLPDADGLEFMTSLQAQSCQCERPPVVMVTGQGDEAIAVRAMKAGAEDYLVKRRLSPELLQLAVHSAIENGRLRQQLSQSQERLQASEDRWQLALKANQDGIWDLNLQTQQAVISERFAQILGVAPNALVSLSDFFGFVHPEDAERVEANWQKYLRGKADLFHCTYRLRYVDGSYKWVLGRGLALWDDRGMPTRAIGTISDITASKEQSETIERQLTQIDRQLTEIETIYTNAPAGLCYHDRDLRFVRINDVLAEIHGLPAAAHIGRTLREILPELAERVDPLHRQVIATGEPILNLEVAATLPSQPGVLRHWLVCYYPHKNRQQQVMGINVVVQEITDRKRNERRLRESQARLQLGASVAGLALARVDYGTNTVSLSTEAARAYGIGITETTITRDRLHATFHPEERELMERVIEGTIDPAGDGWFEREHRIVWPDGDVRWLSVRKQVYFDRAGATPRPDYAIIAAIDITERRRTEELARAQLTEIESIYAAAPVGLCYNDRNLRYVRINDILAEINGVPAQEHIGRTIREILPELADTLEPIYLQVINSGEPIVNIEVSGTNRAQPGVERQWSASFHPQRNGGKVVGVNVMIQEITAAKRAEADRQQAAEVLRQSEERYRYLSSMIPQLVWISTTDGMLTDINDRWVEYTGLTLARAQTEGWQAIVHPEDIGILAEAWSAAQQQGVSYQAEGRVRRADGIYRWHLHQAMPQKNDRGEIIRWFGTATDIHDMKEISAERDRLLADTQAARAEAEAANRSKDEFVAVVAHELRSPLNSVAGWAKLLQNHKFDTATQTKALDTIWRNTQTQVQLVEDLLDISRMIRGNLHLNLTPTNLAAVIRVAIDLVLPQAQAKQIEMATELLPNVEVMGDCQRLQQIVVNLLTNAIKFTPDGGRIAIGQELQANRVLLQVSDTGKGIAAEFLPQIFERFQQGQKNTGSKDGLGLGLAIVKNLVELHHGQITAHSGGIGLGTTFTVELPLLDIPAPPTPAATADDNTTTLAGIRILAVDDEPDMLDLIDFILTEAGAEVLTATSLTAAVTALDRFQPNILLSDIAMPEGSGYELLARIRQLYPAKIRAIALTAYASSTHEERSLQAGFDRHLTKPVDPTELVATISALIGGNSSL